MIQRELQEWFNSSQDFDQGLKLLESIQPESIMLRIFKASGSTQFNQDKLKEILREEIIPVQEAHAANSEVDTFPEYDFFVLPDSLQKDHIRKSELYRAAGKLHAELANCSSDPERSELAHKIMEYMYANRDCWTRIDYYLQYGEIQKTTKFTVPDLQGMSVKDLHRFKANNASNLSKWRRKVQKIQDPIKREELLERITIHENLQKQVTEML